MLEILSVVSISVAKITLPEILNILYAERSAHCVNVNVLDLKGASVSGNVC